MTRWLEQVAKRVEAQAEGKPVPPLPSSPLSREFQGLLRSLAEDLKRQLHDPGAAPPIPAPSQQEAPPQPEAALKTVTPSASVPTIEDAPPPPPTIPALEDAPRVQAPEPSQSVPPIPTSSGPVRSAEDPLPSQEDRLRLEAALGITAPSQPQPPATPPALPPPPAPPPPNAKSEVDELARLIEAEASRTAGSPPAAPTPPAAAPEALDDVTRLIESELAQKSAEPAKPPPRPEPAPAPPPEPAAPASAPLDLMEHEVFAVRTLNSCWTGLLRLLTMCDLLVPAPLQGRKSLLGRIGMGLTALAVAGLAWVAYRRLS